MGAEDKLPLTKCLLRGPDEAADTFLWRFKVEKSPVHFFPAATRFCFQPVRRAPVPISVSIWMWREEEVTAQPVNVKSASSEAERGKKSSVN